MKKVIIKLLLFTLFVITVNFTVLKLSVPLTNDVYLSQLNGDGVDFNNVQILTMIKNSRLIVFFVTAFLVFLRELKTLKNKMTKKKGEQNEKLI